MRVCVRVCTFSVHFKVCGAWTVTMHQWAVSGPVGVLYEFNK